MSLFTRYIIAQTWKELIVLLPIAYSMIATKVASYQSGKSLEVLRKMF
jgi:hypothetical protein